MASITISGKKFLTLIFSFILGASFFATSALAASITTGYGSVGDVQVGMIVGLSKVDSTKVEAINSSRVNEAIGVTVNNNDSPITLSGENEQVFVANTSEYTVLVSDQNGRIRPGDYITLSSISGIGMRADEFQSVVIGQATQEFLGRDSASYLSSTQVKDNAGNTKNINIGKVKVNIGIAKNPLAKNVTDAPEILRRAGQTIAGRAVTAPRLYISLVLLVIVSAISASVIYSAVRSGIISIGRNPLSRKLIIRGIFQMVLVSLIIFLAGMFGVYLILRL
jgi:hypothetical protein